MTIQVNTMIESDDKGLFICYDAILALIPVIIIISTVAQVNMDCSSDEKVLYNQAQDTVDLMSLHSIPGEPSIFEQISTSLSKNNTQLANKIADSYLNSTVGDKKYRLIELNQLNGEICSKGDIKANDNVAVAVKCQGSYLYKLFLST